MTTDAPAAPAVRDMLDKVLGSETFSRSERARNLLRYLVEREQRGEGERLKGTTVAIDVFGKDSEFDPSTDSVVRVQAGRLRELLASYYRTEGAADPLKIYIHRGSYVPTYERECPLEHELGATAGEAGPDVLPAAHEIPRTRVSFMPSKERFGRHIQLMWTSLMVVIAVLVVMLLRDGPNGTIPHRATAEDRTASVVPAAFDMTANARLPSVYVDVDPADGAALAVASLVKQGLAGFDTVDAIARGYVPTNAASAIDFRFSVASSSETKVIVELSQIISGKMLLSRTIDLDPSGGPPIADRIADLLSTTIPVSGVLYQAVEQERPSDGLVRCLLLNDAYYLDQDEARHRAAYTCFEALDAAGVLSPLIYSELASLHQEAVTDGYAYPAGASQDQAFAYARRALRMGSSSAYAHRALGFLFNRAGKGEEALRWMRKAYELNTYDLSMAAALGYAQVFQGQYREGEPILARAVEAASAHPTWWDYSLFLARFMNDDTDGAARAAAALVGVKRQHYLAAQMIVAHRGGDAAKAAAIGEDIRRSYPRFAADPGTALTNASYPPGLVDRLVAAMREAGLGPAS